MKTILVPTDFSRHSENALKAAALIAKHQDAKLLVVHIAGISGTSLIKAKSQNLEETIFQIRLAEKNFSEFLDKSYLKGLQVFQVIKKETNFSEINSILEEHNVSLIVMSSHGTSGLQDFIIGSNTEKVIRFSDVPVLVIKGEASNYKMGVGVYTTDFSEESIEAYKKAKNFFKDWQTEMKMLYVNPTGRKFKNTREIDTMLIEFFQKAEVEAEEILACKNSVKIYSEHSIEEGIFNYSKDINADFIVIPTHARKGIAHILKGSLSADVANHSMIPVLTIKI
ncbi:universal stress protein [Flavobacterium antarcticum]|uniref:universal stress protein n=1 Tax=Flavobacterium antarcticum TaxID=271155 RepID=UPI0003B68EC2|nr:universal stress protein [Flavobacterium antarcticum]